MKNLLVALFVILSLSKVSAQNYGGQIQAKNNAGVIGTITRNLDAIKTYDSIVKHAVDSLHAKLASGIAVTGAFYQATQPVSGAVSVSNFPVTQPVSGTVTVSNPTNSVSVSNFPASQAVTGTFYQSTQPVSIATMPTTPVTGTFFQATQPVSGAVSVSNFPVTQPVSGTVTVSNPTNSVSVSNFPASQAVTGTFYQSTQPVSIATMPSTPVTGTFFQATQPISATALPLPTGAATDATLTGGTQKAITRGGAKGTTVAADVTSIAVDANTQALHTNVTNFPATQAVSGSVSVSNFPSSQAVTGTFFQSTQPVSIATMPTTPVTGTFFQATQPVSLATNTPTLQSGSTTAVTQATAANLNATVTPIAITKGTQGTTGFTTQDLKDAGRTAIALTIEVAGAATTEALATVTESRSGATATTFTSKVITSGKTIRFTHAFIAVETLGSGTAPQRLYVRLRVNTAGATTASSPQQTSWMVANNAAVVKSAAMQDFSIPDGIEFTGNGTATYGITIQFPDWVATTGTVQAKITLIGFEY